MNVISTLLSNPLSLFHAQSKHHPIFDSFQAYQGPSYSDMEVGYLGELFPRECLMSFEEPTCSFISVSKPGVEEEYLSG